MTGEPPPPQNPWVGPNQFAPPPTSTTYWDMPRDPAYMSRMNRILTLVLIPSLMFALFASLIFGMVLAGTAANNSSGAVEPFNTEEEMTLSQAVEWCRPSEGIYVGDGGLSITFDTRGDEDYTGASTGELYCILFQLQAPTNVISHIEQTRALDGRQTDHWNDIEIQWGYHPNSGIAGVIRYTAQSEDS